MALYRKFVRKGAITNKLIYRGHEFVERWEKDVVLMCKGDTISKQVNNTFDNLSVKELETIENLGFYTDFDLEEKIRILYNMTPKVAAVRRKDETTTRSNKNGDYRIHTKTWLSTNSTRDSQDDRI